MARPISSESAFRALSHPTRRTVIELLLKKSIKAGELASHFKHSRGVFSKHLRILQNAGLIEFEREGTSYLYSLVPGAFDSLHNWISKLPKGAASR